MERDARSREARRPAETDVKRLEKYLARRKVETANRAAIREGRKVYDRDFE